MSRDGKANDGASPWKSNDGEARSGASPRMLHKGA